MEPYRSLFWVEQLCILSWRWWQKSTFTASVRIYQSIRRRIAEDHNLPLGFQFAQVISIDNSKNKLNWWKEILSEQDGLRYILAVFKVRHVLIPSVYSRWRSLGFCVSTDKKRQHGNQRWVIIIFICILIHMTIGVAVVRSQRTETCNYPVSLSVQTKPIRHISSSSGKQQLMFGFPARQSRWMGNGHCCQRSCSKLLSANWRVTVRSEAA